MKCLRLIAAIASLTVVLTASPRAAAEVDEVKIAAQFGPAFLPLLIMQESKLVEKHAKELELPNLKVNWARISGADAMNAALLSGNLHFASGGNPANRRLPAPYSTDMLGASIAGDSFTPRWPLDYEFATDRLLWLRVAEFSPNSCTKKTAAQKEDAVAAFGMPAADKIRQQLEPTDQAFFT